MKDNVFYVYVYLDPRKPGLYEYGDHLQEFVSAEEYNYKKYKFDYEPFYIGKGRDRQIDSHLFEARRNRPTKDPNTFKISVIKNILSSGKEPIRIKIVENLEESIAFQKEKELISLIGRRTFNTGPLTNLTEGGDGGPSGKDLSRIKKGQIPWNKGKIGIYSKETLELMSKPKTEEAKQKMRVPHPTIQGENHPKYWLGKAFSAEARKNMRIAQNDPQTRKKKKELAENQWKNMTDEEKTELSRKISESLKGRKQKPRSNEHCRNISEAKKGKSRRGKSIIISGQIFQSITEASKFLDISDGVIRNRIKSNYPNYSLIENKISEVLP